MCRAETRLDGYVTQQLDVMTFCAAHREHAEEGYGFSVLLPLDQFGAIHSVRSLPAGAAPDQLVTDAGQLEAHAALDDMSSLCGRISPGILLRYSEMTWGAVPARNRCSACDTLTGPPAPEP